MRSPFFHDLVTAEPTCSITPPGFQTVNDAQTLADTMGAYLQKSLPTLRKYQSHAQSNVPSMDGSLRLQLTLTRVYRHRRRCASYILSQPGDNGMVSMLL